MNRQVGATTILATLLLLVGAVLLSSQWPTTEAGARALASPVYLVAEIALYLVFLVILDRGLSAAGYALGAFGALGIRLAIGFAAAAEEYFRGGGPYDAHLYPAIFSLPRVVLAVTTAVAILMLLRECLPQSGKTAAKAAKPKQAPKFAFEVEAASGLSDRRPSKVIIVDQTVGAAQRPTVAAAPEPERTFEGFVELPLGVLLRDAPKPIQLAEGRESTLVRIPLGLIGPQLAEGRVALTAGWLKEVSPEGALDISQADAETEVTLPLDEVVGALPPGALDLGPPSPPAWLRELDETEEALFCAA
jgi:hypothetical protein